MKDKKQIIIINGGVAFDSHEKYLNFLRSMEVDLDYLKKVSWKDRLEGDLGFNFEVFNFKMPNKMNAKYKEWKIYFERYIPLFKKEVILMGHSLGRLFLVKYLSENNFSKKINSLYLVSSPYNNGGLDESLGDFTLSDNLENVTSQVSNIFIFHSEDDLIVPKTHALKYEKELKGSEVVMLSGKGHINSEDFPEIVEHLKTNLNQIDS